MTSSENQPCLQPGHLLGGRYRLVRLLARGGMGRVYLAEDLKLPGKRWAVKEVSVTGPGKRLFEQEAMMLARLDHPMLPAVADYLVSESAPYGYLVMEYIEGVTLLDLFEQQRPFPWEVAVQAAIQVCEVFDYLHRIQPEPVIYRDLKPSNVMIDRQNRIRLIDFGIARSYKQDAETDTVLLGTPGFVAPEIMAGHQSDARSDLYSLGAMLYFLLSGGNYVDPYRPGENMLISGIPAPLRDIIGKLVKANPMERFASAAEVRSRLLEVVDKPVSDKPPAADAPAISMASMSPIRKMAVIGSLYGGAGASFVAVSLARAIHRLGLPNACIELPGAKPDLFHLLYGNRNAPANYRFRLGMADLAPTSPYGGYGTGPVEEKWQSGQTEWVPLPPDREPDGWTMEHIFSMLHRQPQPVLIADIGDAWQLGDYDGLLNQADLLVVVCDPSPAKWGRGTTEQAWDKLLRLQRSGVTVSLVVNRDLPFKQRSRALAGLPLRPAAFVPELPSARVWECQWKGVLVQDEPESAELLDEGLKPLLEQLLPENAWKRPNGFRKRSWFRSS